MSKRININKGQRIRIKGREYTFFNAVPSAHGADHPHDLQFRDEQDHRIDRFTTDEFDALYDAGEVVWWNASERPIEDEPREPCESGDQCTGCDQCAAHKKKSALQTLMRVFDENPVSKADLPLQAFLDQQAESWPAGAGPIPKAGTFRRLLRECGCPGDRRRKYIGRRGANGGRKPRIDPLAEQILWEKAEAYWADSKVKSIDVYAALHVALTERNQERAERGLPPIKIPGQTTVWRMLVRHSDYDNTRRRFGSRVAQRVFKPFKGKLEARRLLDVAVMDHTVLDCHVIDDDHHIPVGRPWLTFLIDVKSRYPLAYVISFTPPSVQTAMACLRQAVRPKTALNERHPEVAKWEVFGVPRTILVDNGWEFVGSSFKDACEDAGISVEWAPVKTPEYKGIVERFHHTINKQFVHKLKGAVPFKPNRLAELGIDPQAEAVMLLSEVDELIHQYIVEVYGRNFHTGIKAIPEQVWRERQTIDGIDYAANLKSLDMGLAKYGGVRTLDRKGINFKNLIYSSDTVFDLLNRLLPMGPKRGQAAGTRKVKFKYHPEDLSKISIWDEVNRDYVEIPCTSREYTRGLSEHHHGILEAFAKQEGLAFSSEAERCAAKARLNQRIAGFVNDRLVGVRRRSQRLKGAIETPQNPNLAVSDHPVGAVVIETITMRRQGEATPTASRNRKRGTSSRAAQRKLSTGQPLTLATSSDDIFAGFDRDALVAKARSSKK